MGNNDKKSYRYVVLGILVLVLVFASACGAQTSVPSPAATQSPNTSTPVPTPLPTATPTEQPARSEPVEETEEPTAIPATPTDTPEPTSTPEAEVRYQLVFDATWSAATHPQDFPGNPHFSGLIGAVHTPSTVLWEVGGLASPGMKRMAETGAKKPLDAEVKSLIDNGDACELVSGNGIGVSPGSVEVVLTASTLCPVVSVVTMIAPSPDWFLGVSGLNLMQDGAWVDELVVELYPFDAGTDSGASYTSGNAPTNPLESIYEIQDAPLSVDDNVPALGTFTFTKLGE